MKVFNKLVRDNIVDIIKNKGEQVEYHVLNDTEYRSALLTKLIEEAHELQGNPSIEEVADVLEVVGCIIDSFGFDNSEVFETMNLKRESRGSFNDKIFLISTK